MGKIKAFIGGYINKFYGEKSEHRTNKYLLVYKRGQRLDNNSFLGNFRDFHDYYEFDTINDVNRFLDDEIAKSDRDNWVCYKRYERVPKGAER